MTTHNATTRHSSDVLPMAWRKSTRSQSNGGQCVEVGSWRKSSRSSSNGSPNCVEVGSWRKSTRSANEGGQCVEAGTCTCHGIAIRDSKLPTTGDFPVLSIADTDWTALLATVKTNAPG